MGARPAEAETRALAGPGGQHHDPVSLLEWLHPVPLPLPHHLQTLWPEYIAFQKRVQARVTYLFMRLCKMLFLAMLFPPGKAASMTSLGCHEGQRACGGLDRPEPSHVLECTQDHGCCPGLGHGHTDCVALLPI